MALAVLPRQMSINQNGVPRVAAKLYYYLPTTTTPITTHTTASYSANHPHPVPSVSNGLFPAVYINPAVNATYKLVVTDSADVVIYTEDNVPTENSSLRSELIAGTVTISSLGISYAQTDEEEAALVTPDDLTYPPGHMTRYGVIGSGAVDDAAAFGAMVSSGHTPIGLRSDHTFRFDSAVTLPNRLELDLGGATVKPNGNTRAFSKNVGGLSATASTTVSSGKSQGSRSFVVASGTGIAVGQWVRFSNSDASYQSGSWPDGWAIVTSVAGTTIEIDTPLPVTYSAGGTLTALFFNANLFSDRCVIRNGVIDGVNSTFTSSTGAGMYVSGYTSVDIDVEFRNFDAGGSTHNALQIYQCIDARLNGRCDSGISNNNLIDVQDVRSMTVPEYRLFGSHFGLNFIRVDSLAIGNLIGYGRRGYEFDETAGGASTRGLKLVGCADAVIGNIIAKDYLSGLKIESNHRVTVGNIHCINSSYASTTDVALNLSSQGTLNNQSIIQVANAVIDLSGGIGLYGDITGDAGTLLIGNLTVRNCGSSAVYMNAGRLHVSNAHIANWNTANLGTVYAIRAVDGGCFDNLTIRNTDNTDPCFLPLSAVTAGSRWCFGDINRVDGNPLFLGALLFENAGTTAIASGTTAIAVTHGLTRTPALSEIFITLGELSTTDPGQIYVDTIGSTQFTVRCRTNPGASNLDLAWRAKLTMPVTA